MTSHTWCDHGATTFQKTSYILMLINLINSNLQVAFFNSSSSHHFYLFVRTRVRPSCGTCAHARPDVSHVPRRVVAQLARVDRNLPQQQSQPEVTLARTHVQAHTHAHAFVHAGGGCARTPEVTQMTAQF